MKHERLRTGLIAAVLALMMAAGSMGVLVTGLNLRLEDGMTVAAVWFFSAALFSFLYSRRHGDWILLCLFALAAGYLLHRGTLLTQLKAMCQQISYRYDDVYHWGVLIFPEKLDRVIFVDLPVTAWGLLLEAAVADSVTRRRNAVYGIIPAALPLGLCLVIPTAIPELWALILLLGSIWLLVLTGNVRRESAAQGNRLALGIALPVMAVLGMLILAFPKDQYVNRSGEVTRYIADKAAKLTDFLPETGQMLFSPQEAARNRLDLSTIDGQDVQDIPVMKIQTDTSGTVYLRGQDYDIYTGTDWQSTTGRTEDFGGWGEITGRITVCTFAPHDLMYVPYFPGTGTMLTEGKLPNEHHGLEYFWDIYSMGSASGQDALKDCLKLPDSTAEAAQDYLPQSEDSVSARAAKIRNRVRTSAAYDRRTPAMPSGERDFAIWFLSKSDTGYCVHFASAAVVLLRASGIPARYVTGYKAEAVAGEEVVVTTHDAHAWAEYFDADQGCWVILEATPADLTEQETVPASEPTETAEKPTETQPPVTEKPETEPEDIEQKASPDLRKVMTVAAWILAIPVAAGILIFQRLARLELRKRKQRRGNANQRALALWQETELLAKLLRETPPEQLRELAQKARFSQYMLEDEELVPFAEYRRRSRRRLEKRPWYRRALYRYVYAAL